MFLDVFMCTTVHQRQLFHFYIQLNHHIYIHTENTKQQRVRVAKTTRERQNKKNKQNEKEKIKKINEETKQKFSERRHKGITFMKVTTNIYTKIARQNINDDD